MTDPSDTPPPDGGVDPYAPPEHAVDSSAKDRETRPDVQIAPEQQADESPLRRVFANFWYLAGRTFWRIGTTWALLLLVPLSLVTAVGMPVVLDMESGGFDWRRGFVRDFGGLAPTWYVGVCLLAGIGLLASLIGLACPTRRVGVEEGRVYDAWTPVVRDALSRFGKILTTLAATATGVVAGASATAMLVISPETLEREPAATAAIQTVGTTIALLSTPLHYRAATRDGSLTSTFTWFVNVLFGEFWLLAPCIALLGCGWFLAAWMLTTIGSVLDPAIPAILAISYILWLFSIAVAATLEERRPEP